MKQIFLFLGTLAISGLYAQQTQVGINTSAPNATLDIQANPNAVAGTNEGILIPRISKEKVAQMTTPETSTLVYVNDVSFTTTEPKVANITKVGFYHYNGTEWVAGLGDDTSIYTQNGTLTENRTVGMNGKNLLFTGNGNVGIGTNAPMAKLDVLGNVKASQFHSYSLVSDTNLHPANINLGATGGTFENPAYVKKGNTLGAFVSRDMRSNNEAAVVNSLFYGGSEIYAFATEDFSATNKGSNLIFRTTSNGQKQSAARILIDENGKTKIGGITEVSPGVFSSPQATLDITGNVKIADGTQYDKYVLTSDTNGLATWKPVTLNLVVGVNNDPGIDIYYKTTQYGDNGSIDTRYRNTGSYIDLPPGKWQVTVQQLITNSYTNISSIPSNQQTYPNSNLPTMWMFLRTTFSDQPNLTAGSFATRTADIYGASTTISFTVDGPVLRAPAGNPKYAVGHGSLIINNTSNVTKRYYYIAGNYVVSNSAVNVPPNYRIERFGANWAENLISALRVN